LSIGIGCSYKAVDVVNTLEKAVSSYGTPKVIKVDNGPEFISKELDMWAAPSS
jgi:putative transposase